MLLLLLGVTGIETAWAEPAGILEADQDLTELSLEELMDVEITSVSKKKGRLRSSAAALFVITQEDIRRSGVHEHS